MLEDMNSDGTARQLTEAPHDLLSWLPTWLSASLILVLAAGAAYLIHVFAWRVIRRARFAQRRLWDSLIVRATYPARFALMLIALGIALPASGLPDATQGDMIEPLSALFILAIGWGCIEAVGLVSDLYLGRIGASYENALTRKHITQVRLLHRAGQILIGLIALGAAMMTLPGIRQYGVSLFASAGAAGIVVGLAARPLLSNLLAGIQIAITQPVKIEDSVVINGEWGWVEDITSTYLVVRIWDWRRLIVPLSWFLEQPFQNWTRESAAIIGGVHLFVDYRTPIDEVRKEVDRIVHASPLWDQNVVNVQVVEATANAIELRVLATAKDASKAWDLRCEIRERLIAFLRDKFPECLPRQRLHLSGDIDPGATEKPPRQESPAPADIPERAGA
jgi:small-conductance mechanosensitive channel